MNRRTYHAFLATLSLFSCLLWGCQPDQDPAVGHSGSASSSQPDAAVSYGWETTDGKRRYLLPDGTYATGWLSLADGRYYLDGSGAAVTGRAAADGQEYYFDDEGRMVSGIVELDGTRYLFGSDGTLASAGWTEYKNETYYVIENGEIFTGWLLLEENSYYLKPDGTMAAGRTEIDDAVFYFTPDGIHVTLVNPWHFIPEDYEVDLVTVRGYQVDARCAEALAQMLSDCERAGLEPRLCSAYRTQEKQEQLFTRKVRTYTSKGYSEDEAKELAGTEVAVPGTSEHQLGLAVDVVDNGNWNLDETQASTPTQIWLMEHCWEYGFILRYPNEKSAITGIIYEPWHYRYVGVEMAMELKNSGLCLEEYLDAVVE